MYKPLELKINSFYGGLSDDKRKSSSSEFSISKHFDIFSHPNRLTPYRNLAADTNDGSSSTGMKQYYVKDFLYPSASGKLYGLGQTAGGLTEIFQKADATTGNWSVPTSSTGNGVVQNGCFVEYKDYAWGFQGTNQVFKWGLLSGTPSITNSAGTIGTIYSTITAVAVNAGGTLYNVNDILTLAGGTGGQVIVSTVTAGGVVSGVTILQAGYNYSTGSKATTVNQGAGTGCTITISTIGDTSTTISSVAQGIIAKDDNLYLPYNNILVRVYPSGTVQDQAFKLPTNFKITSVDNFGNYLAIGCAPISTFNGISKVFLWNLTSPDIQESIDWGEGEIRVVATIEGMIVGITDRYLNNATGAGRGSMIIQTYQGGTPQVVKEVFTEALSGKTMPLSKAIKNNRVFFPAKIMTNSAGTTYDEGIWSFGRKNLNYPFTLTLDIIDENITTAGIQSFGTAANYFFIAHSADGSIDKTSATATYTFTSIYESQILNLDQPTLQKQLLTLSVYCASLPASSTITAKYRIDGATSWTTIGTITTTGLLKRDFVNIESTGADFASFIEAEFRIESVGGAEITGYRVEALPLIGAK